MSDTLAPLILDFLEWIAAKPRPYSEVMDVWRTSCPRLTVWEDANERGFILRRHDVGRELIVDLSAVGQKVSRGEWTRCAGWVKEGEASGNCEDAGDLTPNPFPWWKGDRIKKRRGI